MKDSMGKKPKKIIKSWIGSSVIPVNLELMLIKFPFENGKNF